MSRVCTICSHEAREKIDLQLASGGIIRGIARTFRVSEDSLTRHKAHIATALAKAAERRELSVGDSILSRLERLYQRAEKILQDAERSGDGRLALQAIRETREVLAGVFALANRAAETGTHQRPMFEVYVVHGDYGLPEPRPDEPKADRV